MWNKQVKVVAGLHNDSNGEDRDWRLKFDLKLNSASGPKIRAESGWNGESKDQFSVFVRHVLEYVPSGEPGYQEGKDKVVNAYGVGMKWGHGAGMVQYE